MARKNSNNHHIPFPAPSGGDDNPFGRDPLDVYFDECERRHMRRHTAIRGLAVA